MNTKVLTVGILGVIAGFIGGFLLANGLNRAEITALKSRGDQGSVVSGNASTPGSELELSNDEIKARIAEADANPTNFRFQKNLGIAFYSYGAMKRDAETVGQAVKLLERATSLDPTDYDVTVALGNAYFDIGYFRKDQASLQKAREVYNRALAQKPEDADVLTNLALAYYLDEPADLAKSLAGFQKALKVNPKHERALQFLTQSFMRQGNFDEASKTLDKLKAANPKNDAIAGLTSQIAAKEAPPVK